MSSMNWQINIQKPFIFLILLSNKNMELECSKAHFLATTTSTLFLQPSFPLYIIIENQ